MLSVNDFDYDLPEELIADRPPKVRGSTRLLVLDRYTGELKDSAYADLADWLQPGDLLVLNNTKVIKARLLTLTEDGKTRELLLLEKHGEHQSHHRMKVLYRGKLRVGMRLFINKSFISVEAVHDDGTAVVHSEDDLLELANMYGAVPLPPYMHRDADDNDTRRYQTVFASHSGSVAAPTASLNLTDELFHRLDSKGVRRAELTLHVGLGTFLPIRVDDVAEHKMHQEYFHIPLATVEAIRRTKAAGGRVVAVGTTVTRTLEYTASKLLDAKEDIAGEADIFIYPGYEFKVVDAMLTNFHAPRSTVLMMAAAFAGWDNLRAAYEHAKIHNYQFLSYGDSMLIGRW